MRIRLVFIRNYILRHNHAAARMARKVQNVRITDIELEVLEIVHAIGPGGSEKIHESMNPKPDYLLVLRALHGLVEKGLLQRMIINKKQFYKTSRQYAYMKDFLAK